MPGWRPCASWGGGVDVEGLIARGLGFAPLCRCGGLALLGCFCHCRWLVLVVVVFILVVVGGGVVVVVGGPVVLVILL